MSVYLVETYLVQKSRVKEYTAVIRKIHKSLRRHSAEIPELISYKTFTVRTRGGRFKFTELFEFTDSVGKEKFVSRFSETGWLRTLGRSFHRIVRRPASSTWEEFLKDMWFVR